MSRNRYNRNKPLPKARANNRRAHQRCHHGGRDTNSSTLLDLVFPPGIATADRYAIISSGQRENLPADDTLERLERAEELLQRARELTGRARDPR